MAKGLECGEVKKFSENLIWNNCCYGVKNAILKGTVTRGGKNEGNTFSNWEPVAEVIINRKEAVNRGRKAQPKQQQVIVEFSDILLVQGSSAGTVSLLHPRSAACKLLWLGCIRWLLPGLCCPSSAGSVLGHLPSLLEGPLPSYFCGA